MKLRTKLSALTALILLGALIACGIFSVQTLLRTRVEQLAEQEREALMLTERAFQQAGSREELAQMGELAQDAYLRYQFKQFYPDRCALLKDDACIQNLTDYEILHPEDLTEPYMVQQLGNRRLLLLKQDLEYPQGFQVLAVRDISFAWEEARRQSIVFAEFSLAAFLLAMISLTVGIRYILRSLETLRRQAEAIGRGDFSRKSQLTSRDELGILAQSMNLMAGQLSEKMQDLELLPGAMAHEMKTPVTSILGYADTLLHVRLNPQQQRSALEALMRAAGRLNQMSEKLLQLIGSYGNQAIVFSDVRMSDVIAQVCQDVQEQVRQEGIQLTICLKNPLIVSGDQMLLTALLENLVSNSVKALESGGEIRLSIDGSVLSVSDNGCGIPSADLPHVTKAFYMADKARSRRRQGSGLGLALAGRIASLHSASLEIESVEGKGTTVKLLFYKTVTCR